MKIAIVVAAYFTISLSMVFTNKALLSNPNTIQAPLFVTWFQCVVTVIICAVLGEIGHRSAPGTFFTQFPRVKYDLAIAAKVMKLSCMFVGMITFVCRCARVQRVCHTVLTCCCLLSFLFSLSGSTTCA